MSEIKFLREKGILPLVTLPKTWTVSGDDLKNAVDFLSQFTLRYESHTSREYNDDY